MGTKFNLNRQPVPDEEINSHKDFGELVKTFKKQSIEKARSDTSFFKNKKITYSAIIAGATVICTVTYFAVFKNNPPKQLVNDKINTQQKNTSSPNTQPTKLNKAFIAPPISKLKVPVQKFTLTSEQGATFKTKSNSKISIPKNSFVNNKGAAIVGDVQIEFTEYHNQADIIASGIPMQYDSAGIQSHFESAGMIDIKGFQNNEPVFISPNKTITVELQSNNATDKFNMYALDTIAKNWTYLHRDNSLKGLVAQKEKPSKKTITNVALVNEKTKAIEKQLSEIPPKIEIEKTSYTKKITALPKSKEPQKPVKTTQGRPQFQLDVDGKEFPELATFKNIIFEVGDENKNYNTKLADVTWSSADISEGSQKGKNYVLTLKLKDRVEKLIVYPTLSGNDFDNASKVYETKFADYKTLLAKRLNDERKIKEDFEKKQADYVAEQKKLTDDLLKERIKIRQQQEEQLANQFNGLSNQNKVTRIFQVSNFGMYNADCPNSLPKGQSIKPTYFVNNTPIGNVMFTFLVCKNKNLVYNINPSDNINFNPSENYSLCVIANGKTFVCNPTTFAANTINNQSKITLTEVIANDVVDLKNALGI
jgi:hypothetical protein